MKKNQLLASLFLVLLPLSLMAGDTTTFQQRRQEAQKRAENYNNAVYSGDQRATNEEVAAAIKNFNPEVEAEYINEHNELISSFDLLNSLEHGWNFYSFDKKYGAEWDQWMQAGGVGAYAP
ncbi:hypothetical protein JXA84_00130 [candidate division WOR-3 bacterium]|nr:hypothetical protein [candidate division WOR-3 bacterium]